MPADRTPEGPPPAGRSLWAGRTAALLGIVLIALNLRTAVSAISPITALVARDIPLDSIAVGLLGALPPIAFALSGLVAPLVSRRLGLESTLVIACLAMIAGPIVRGMAPSYPVLVLGTAIALGGMGFGNVLLPPAVKRYFPDRLGLVTAIYVTLLSISNTLPPLIASPVAEATSWRISVALWAVLALCALGPWLRVRMSARRAVGAGDAESPTGDNSEGAPAPARLAAPIWRSGTARALALLFAVTALNTYAFFAWLPTLIVDTTGATQAEGGALLALYGIIGLPLALVVPALAARLRNVGWLIQAGAASFIVGYLGLMLAPGVATGVWVVFASAGGVLFPLSLVLINLRTRTQHGSTALSGFTQGIGYGLGALGPVFVGILHDATGSWREPLVFLMATVVLGSVAGFLLSKPAYIEDELDSIGRRAR